MGEYVMVTDWEKVEPDDFYLSTDWRNIDKADRKKFKAMAKEGKLFIGYVVKAQDYVIYGHMDAQQVFIDEDGSEMMSCESEVIGNKHEHTEAYSM